MSVNVCWGIGSADLWKEGESRRSVHYHCHYVESQRRERKENSSKLLEGKSTYPNFLSGMNNARITVGTDNAMAVRAMYLGTQNTYQKG